MVRHFTILFVLTGVLFASVSKNIIQSNTRTLVIELDIVVSTEADLFPISMLIGLPSNTVPETQIEFSNKSKLPFKTLQEPLNGFEWINQQELQNLETGTIRVSPIAGPVEYYQKIVIHLEFEKEKSMYRTPVETEIETLKNRIINWTVAQSWIKKDQRRVPRVTTFPDGRWFQFFLNEDGIISIPYSTLSSSISDISQVDPRSCSIFMSQELGRSRTQATNQDLAENLVELAILVSGEEDGSFDPNDKIIFYGRGSSGFDLLGENIQWHQNVYFSSNSCWLLVPDNSEERGKRIEPETQPQSGTLIEYGLSSYHAESDLINLKASGTEWVGSPILAGGSQPILADLPDPKSGVNMSVSARFRGHSVTETSTSYHELTLLHGSLNGDQIGSTMSWSGTASRTLSDNTPDISLDNGSNVFYIKNSSTDANSSPYLDYFEIQYGRELSFSGEYEFVSPLIGQDVRFSFSGEITESVQLWDISDPASPGIVPIDDSGYSNVTLPFSTLSRFVVFDISDLNSVTDLELKEDQQFHMLRQTGIQANYFIIGPEQFRDEAIDLVELRNPARYASIESIYDEFSAGNPDPMAIRSFIQWTQEAWQSPAPNCALLLGDGGYDYRNITGQSSIVVPTIQVQSSRTYATDDLLATVYGSIPEIATGRYPAKNEEEVVHFVEKVLEIETNPNFGPWRQRVTLVADDAARPEPSHGSIATGKSHTLNSEQLAAIVPPFIYIDKLYMMEYPEVSDASAYGVIKPAATEALFNSLSSGTAIISYIGHGSAYQLAQEKLLHMDRGDLNQINTGTKLPLWVVGTCSFGHFDDPLTESFSEELIREPMNAASMVISTSRPITVTGNERYTQDLFEYMFNNGEVSDAKVGILLQSIKDGTSEAQYFHLFGDPAMQLPMPKEILSDLTISPDTLKTLETGTYSGSQSLIQNSGNGFVTLLDADRDVTREYEISSETYTLSYTLPGATLFRGLFSFSGPSFNGDIRIPQDISYADDPARLLTYIHNDENEAGGAISSIQLAGGSGTQDTFGPQISFETITGTGLEQGDHFPENEDLIIRLSDPLGINLTNETGHEIMLTDMNTNNFLTITDDFYYNQNSIITGTINYPVVGQGIHIKIKAWDNANNPSEKEIKLYRTQVNKLEIYNAYNFPNPFATSTQFTFEVTQNIDLTLDLYTLGGRRIKSFEKFNLSAGYHTIDWDGLDSFGGNIANGVYLYRLKAIGDESTVSYIGRCAKYQ